MVPPGGREIQHVSRLEDSLHSRDIGKLREMLQVRSIRVDLALTITWMGNWKWIHPAKGIGVHQHKALSPTDLTEEVVRFIEVRRSHNTSRPDPHNIAFDRAEAPLRRNAHLG